VPFPIVVMAAVFRVQSVFGQTHEPLLHACTAIAMCLTETFARMDFRFSL
jgi:hypothetical protein